MKAVEAFPYLLSFVPSFGSLVAWSCSKVKMRGQGRSFFFREYHFKIIKYLEI
jgi:hypothetical protein